VAGRERLRATFAADAELYRRVRPGYPAELFDDLAALAPGRRVLEIGPGTGQATASLGERGYEVVAVELGASLAAVARRELARFPAVAVVEADFETWEPEQGAPPFDVVLAATSFHWLDPALRFAKPARLLRAGGALAVVETHHVVPDGGDRWFLEVQDVYDRVTGDRGGPPGPPEEVPDGWPELDTRLFEHAATRRYLREREYTADEYLDLLATYSNNIAREPEERRRLFAELRARIEARPDPRVRKAYLTLLRVARRRPVSGP
jgi:SAM-dependent methyltransferase